MENEEWPNVPAECEDLECKDCPLGKEKRIKRECPWLEIEGE